MAQNNGQFKLNLPGLKAPAKFDHATKAHPEIIMDVDKLAIFDQVDKDKNGCLSPEEASVFEKKVKELEAKREKIPYPQRVSVRPKPKKLTQKEQAAVYQKQGKDNASQMRSPIYDAWTMGGVDTKEFQTALSHVNKDNIIQTLAEYKKLTKGNSLFKDIVDEKTDGFAVRREAIKKLFGVLVQRAESSGMDKYNLQALKGRFDAFVNGEFKKVGAVNDEEIDRIVDGVLQGITNAGSLTAKERQELRSANSVSLQRDTVNSLIKRGNSAQKSLQAQRNYDGWAGRTADFVSGLWGSNNRYSKVSADVQKYQSQMNALSAAFKQGSAKFEAKFHETFGVDYDPVQVAAYKKNEATYIKAAKEYAKEQTVNNTLSQLLKSDTLREEYSVVVQPMGPASTYVSASKEQVYKREFDKFAELLGGGDKALGSKRLNQAISDQGLANASIDQKYKALSSFAKKLSAEFHKSTMRVSGGRSFDQVTKAYDNSYTAAFGTQNDIARRVSKYNASQEAGAAVVKGVAVTAVSVITTVATGGAAAPLVVGAVSAGASLAADVSDDLSSKTRRADLAEFNEAAQERLKGYGTKAVITGVGSGLGAQVSNTTAALTQSMGAGGRIAVGTGVDVAFDSAQDVATQLITTGEVDGSQVLKTAATSLVVNGVVRGVGEFRANSHADELGEALQEAVDNIDEADIDAMTSATLAEQAAGHTRYNYSYDEAIDGVVDFNGRPVTPDVGDISVGAGAVRTRNVDLSAADAQVLHQKTVNLLGNNADPQFAQGIEALQARIVSQHGGSYAAAMEHNAGVMAKTKTGNAFLQNPRALALQLDEALPQDCASMAANAYSPKAGKPERMGGFTQVAETSANNGFAAKAFVKDDVVVVAFRGSDDMADLAIDHKMLNGQLPDQFQNAQDFLAQMQAKYPDAKFVVTGHSLGGSLAELTASANKNVVGVTFDAVGTKGLVTGNAATGLADNANVTAYVIDGDIISNSSAHVGHTTRVAAAENSRFGGVYDEHAIGNFTEARTWTDLAANQEKMLTGLQNQFPVAGTPVAQRAYANGEAGFKVVSVDPTGEATNAALLADGFSEAPFTPGKEVKIVTTTEDMTFVRTLDGENTGVLGSWLMPKSEIEGLTPLEIADKWALPQVPTMMCDVTVPAGTQIRIGECNPILGFNGGGTQYQLMQRIDMKLYDNVKMLPKTK